MCLWMVCLCIPVRLCTAQSCLCMCVSSCVWNYLCLLLIACSCKIVRGCFCLKLLNYALDWMFLSCSCPCVCVLYIVLVCLCVDLLMYPGYINIRLPPHYSKPPYMTNAQKNINMSTDFLFSTSPRPPRPPSNVFSTHQTSWAGRGAYRFTYNMMKIV